MNSQDAFSNTSPMILIGVGAAAFLITWLFKRRWGQLNSKDMGSMSRQWVAENDAKHP